MNNWLTLKFYELCWRFANTDPAILAAILCEMTGF